MSGSTKVTISLSSPSKPSAPEDPGADKEKEVAIDPNVPGFDSSPGSKFFDWSLTVLEKYGRNAYGGKFRIHETDYDVVHKLLVYFLGFDKEAEKLNLDLNKGIFLTGPVGCGKTALFTLMKHAARPGRYFFIKPCREISFEFFSDGYEVIHRYSRMSYEKDGPKAYCFDDLGAESTLHHFGDECCVMAEILTSRYDLFKSAGMITHVTTNYTSYELEKIYGNRVRSRMREMFNLISFKNGTGDKR
jgi:hypothetical protein